MYKFEKQLMISTFIYDKIEEGYTVRKLKDNIYEFKIKKEKLDITEKIHSLNFLRDFININK